jgi:flagellar protein FlaF
MPDNAINAYTSVQKETMDGREMEASLLSRAAALLCLCQDMWDQDGHFERLDNALRFNQRLWTFFQAELMEESNPLPQDIKRNLINLSAFIDKRTFDVMAYPAREKLTVLININKQIAEGLAPAPAAEPEQSATP